MSDYIYDSLQPYLGVAKAEYSPQVYLNAGYQPYWIAMGTMVPMGDDAGVLSADDLEQIVASCTDEEQRSTLDEQGAIDFIYDSSTGKFHLYLYVQETGYLVIALNLDADALLKQGIECNCSDIHIPTEFPPSWRRFGTLCPIWEGAPKLTAADTEEFARSFLTEKEWDRINARGDVDFAYQNSFGRYRASVVRQRLGYDMAYRIINTNVKTMDEIGLPKEYVIPLTRYTNGLILVTGSVGSGKSTTLSSIVDFINADRRDHIITLEDPIETIFESKLCQVNQREVHKHTESFARALRASLREDPDIIMVGEMRDLETISLALTAAETGHLVLGTLHTGSAARTIDRILDAFPVEERDHIRIMVSESLRGILSQQLIPKKDGSGRVMALEMLVNTAAVANCIREGKTFMIPGLIQTGKAQGMRLLDDALQELYLAGTISAEECQFRAADLTMMDKFLAENPEKS